MSDLITAIDIGNRAAASAKHDIFVMLARHLRIDHAYGRRRVAKLLGVSETWVKRNIDEV